LPAVRHLNIGAGKIIYQNLPRINKAILEGEFINNPAFVQACQHVNKNSSQLHLIGLLSSGGVHSSTDHLNALLEVVKQQEVKNVYLHLFLDGRDMEYNSGLELIKNLKANLKELGLGKIATIGGRFYAMDRDNHWDRIEKAYVAMVEGKSEKMGKDGVALIEQSYKEKKYDEEFIPSVITDEKNSPVATVKDNDAIIFFNFRADRARQLTQTFVDSKFDKFKAKKIKDLYFVSMTQYDKNLPTEVAFSPQTVETPLAKIISDNELKQLHIAETEKYAHVTYFLNGGRQEPFPNEDQNLIKSPAVESYADVPEMSALKVKDEVLKKLSENTYDFIVINFANPDMVGHTGNLKATVKAVETIDKCLSEIVPAVLSLNGVVLITADHGNAEELINLQSGEIIKEHSINPVPLIIAGDGFQKSEVSNEKIDLNLLTPSGVLADIAPTILKIINLPQPEEMTGRSLV